MKLQSKVFIILTILWIIVCLGIYIDSKLTLEHDYKKVEKNLAEKDMKRVNSAINNKLLALRLYTNSWSEWDDAYEFMANKNEKFILSSFVPGTFISANINFFLFYETNGNFYYGRAFDLGKKQFTIIPTNLLSFLNNHLSFVMQKLSSPGLVGIISIPEGNIAMSSLPVLTSDGKGPVRGTLLMGYFITPEFFNTLAQTVGLKITFISLPELSKYPLAKQTYAQLLNQPYQFVAKDVSTAYGFTMLKDINNHPIGILQIELPRYLYNEGLITIYHYLLIVILLGIIILITTIYLLKTLVLNRILNVNKQIIDINSQGHFNNRIKISGHDEITQLISSINYMLELIELSQEELKYRISLRTKDMEKLFRLNRNLFKEMSKQRSIEAKLREDEKLLRKMAYYDTLTGLPNRALFNELLQQALAHAEHSQSKVAILFIDVDKFKKMNDTYGHDFGDNFLKIIALRLKQILKDNGVAARLAGDEFIVFLSDIKDTSMVDSAAVSIFEYLTASITIDNIRFDPTLSIGISLYPDDGKTLIQIINAADLAMYYAKKKEGNSYHYYSEIENLHSSTPYL